MKKIYTTTLIISLIAASLAVGVLVWGVRYESRINQKVNSDILEVNDEPINTTEWLTYRNEVMGFQLKYPKDWRVDERTKGDIIKDGKIYTSWFSTIDKENKYYLGMTHSYLNLDNSTEKEKLDFINNRKEYTRRLDNVPGVIVMDKVKDGRLRPTAIISTDRYIIVFFYDVLNFDYIDEYHKNETFFYKMMDSIQIIK